MNIREYDPDKDLSGLRNCGIELQDFERRLDSRRPAGEEIIDTYIPRMLARCEKCKGKVLLADMDGEIAGYVTILTRVSDGEPEDGDYEYGLVADLVVREKFRRMGYGEKLLEAAEAHARSCGVRWLRIGALAGNPAAKNLYLSKGFSNSYAELEKDLSASKRVP